MKPFARSQIFTILVLFLSIVMLSGCNRSNITSNTKKVTQEKIIFLGDSIMFGSMGPDGNTSKNIPYWVDHELNTKGTNRATNGSTISGTQKSDMSTIVSQTNFKDYNYCVIGYGINDYLKNRRGESIKTALTDNIVAIKHSNPKIKIFAVLPVACYIVPSNNQFIAKQAANTKNDEQYTENNLSDLLKTVYLNNNIPVLDWRSDPVIGNANYKKLLADHQVHPNELGYQLTGKRVALFIQTTRLF